MLNVCQTLNSLNKISIYRNFLSFLDGYEVITAISIYLSMASEYCNKEASGQNSAKSALLASAKNAYCANFALLF